MQVPLVLFVEDDLDILGAISDVPKGIVEFLPASTLVEAKRLFLNHKEKLAAITMDGSLTDGQTPSLVRFIREQGYLGPVIATSGNDELQKVLMQSGCSHDCRKPKDVLNLLEQVLNLKL